MEPLLLVGPHRLRRIAQVCLALMLYAVIGKIAELVRPRKIIVTPVTNLSHLDRFNSMHITVGFSLLSTVTSPTLGEQLGLSKSPMKLVFLPIIKKTKMEAMAAAHSKRVLCVIVTSSHLLFIAANIERVMGS